jgi:ABC-type transporter Mla subunit MlaD
MVTQAPKRAAVLAAVGFALSCIGLMIFVWTQFGGTVPFAPQGYRAHVMFKETGLLVSGADVRIAGVNVGRVTAVANRGGTRW